MPVTVATVHDSFTGFQEEWSRLVDADPQATIFQTWEWQHSWWEIFGDGSELHLLALRDASGLLVGLAPLHRTNENCLSLLGGTDVTDYVDIVAAPGYRQPVWEAVFQHLADLGNTIGLELQSIPEWSDTAAIVANLAQSRGLRVATVGREPCPVITLAPTWDGYLENLGKKDRHEVRRKLRRLERELPTAHLHATRCERDLDQDLEDFFHLHRASDHAKARFMSETMERFFRSAAHRLFALGHFRLYFLQTPEQRLAAALCFSFRDILYVYNSGYEPRLAPLSVGVVLFALCIQRAISKGRHTFDFLRGDESYKYHLGGVDTFVSHIVVGQTLNE